jgi:tetratricopeptide (TPR) repeat protein
LAFGGLVLMLAVAAARKLREGYQVKGRLLPFLLFLILESPELVSFGILAGMLAGALAIRQIAGTDSRALLGCVGGGAVLGIVFGLLRHVRQRLWRLGLSLLLAAVLVTGALLWFGEFGDLGEELGLNQPIQFPKLFGAQLLLGIPLFYLLTFAGREEESEIEIGAVCAALALGAGMLMQQSMARGQILGLILSMMLFLWYTSFVLPRLRVFKHCIRGFSYAQIGRHRQAILSFRRASQLDPQNALAREGFWGVHRVMDLSQLAGDPETLAVVDLQMCLERAGSLLLAPNPSAEKLQEAHRLLDLVQTQRPEKTPAVRYWRAVAFTHARLYDQAADELEAVVDPTRQSRTDPERQAVLLQAWQLALRLHPELIKRIGTPQLASPGRRMDAIGAVERQLAQNPDDADVWGFKRVLYQDLTEEEYQAGVANSGGSLQFDHGYAQQLGLALINDRERWRRGGEYLRMAAHGLPALGPSIFSQIALAHQREGLTEQAWHNYELAKRAGRSVGLQNLGEEDRQAYFNTVKLLADSALAQNEIDLAIENYQLYTAYPRSGLETLRTLAELCERKGDPLAALCYTEQALLYSGTDKNLLERKDCYYYSVMPDHLRARLEGVRNSLDVAYCLGKARKLLDAKNWDLDTLDWAQHLVQLVRVVQPDNRTAKQLEARARLRRGEKEEAIALLEEIRTPRPEKFANAEEEDAWYLANKLLGELYLYELHKPELDVACLKDFRGSSKSGADTMYKLGQAYEQLGDLARAVKFYKHVVAYDNHPLAPDARDALYRLESHQAK